MRRLLFVNSPNQLSVLLFAARRVASRWIQTDSELPASNHCTHHLKLILDLFPKDQKQNPRKILPCVIRLLETSAVFKMKAIPAYESPHLLPREQKVVEIDVKVAFQGLDEKAKLYAHHLSRASWLGGLIVLHQVR
jgi:hypothetical protein